MSTTVVVRANQLGPPVFPRYDLADAWVSDVAVRSGLSLEGGAGEWLLVSDQLVLEAGALDQADKGLVEFWMTPRLSNQDASQMRESSMAFRRVLGELLALADDVGGELHASDDDLRLHEPDLDHYAMTRLGESALVNRGVPDAATPDAATVSADRFLGVDFASLTQAEAQRLMNRWLADERPRLSWLAGRVAHSANASSEIRLALDRSPDSLSNVWRGIRHQLRWRGSGEAFDPTMLPIWANNSIAYSHPDFSDDTLWLVDALARYWAVVVCEATGDRWALGRSRVPGYIDQNMPILQGIDVFPCRLLLVAASRQLRGDRRAGDEALRRLFDVWTEAQG